MNDSPLRPYCIIFRKSEFLNANSGFLFKVFYFDTIVDNLDNFKVAS